MNRRIANKIAAYAGNRQARIGLVLRAGQSLSGWPNCYLGRKCEVIVRGVFTVGRIVCDPPKSATVILRDDGIMQRGGVYRPV